MCFLRTAHLNSHLQQSPHRYTTKTIAEIFKEIAYT
jgi:hypothetical protein